MSKLENGIDVPNNKSPKAFNSALIGLVCLILAFVFPNYLSSIFPYALEMQNWGNPGLIVGFIQLIILFSFPIFLIISVSYFAKSAMQATHVDYKYNQMNDKKKLFIFLFGLLIIWLVCKFIVPLFFR